jgi:uncharacterized protein YndB with AHSA1/START domain
MNAAANNPTPHAIVIEREFDAPLDLVWRAWTEPELIARWFGPEGFSTRVDKQELRVGGEAVYVMIGPDGTEYPSVGIYREIVPKQRIVSTDDFGEEYRGSSTQDLPAGMVMTTTFEALGDRTKVTISVAHPTEEEKRKHEEMGVVQGWQSSFNCLDALLAEVQGQAS